MLQVGRRLHSPRDLPKPRLGKPVPEAVPGDVEGFLMVTGHSTHWPFCGGLRRWEVMSPRALSPAAEVDC